MSELSTQAAALPDDLPETVYLVNEELRNDQVKFHIYVERSHSGTSYSSYAGDSFHKPRCGQDGRKRDTTDDLIEVPMAALLEHLLPGMCRRCLNHMDLPQPDTDVMGGEIRVTDSTIELTGGKETERVLDVSHPYREADNGD